MDKRYRFSAILLFLSILILIAGSSIHYRLGYFSYDQSGHAWGADDAYISYRYAQNLSLGNGLVFNPGERVEGYSNLLLVIVASLLLSSGVALSNLYFAITLLNLFIAIWILIIFHNFIYSQLDQEKASIGTLILSLSPLLWIWVTAGMEVPLVILLQLLIWISVNHLEKQVSRFYTGVWITATLLLCLTRADGFVFPAISIFFLALKRQKRTVSYFLAVLLLVMGILTIWRYSYYGQLLPNTYYVKVSGTLIERIKIAAVFLAYIAINQSFLGYISTIVQSIYSVLKESFTKRQPFFSILRFDTFASIMWIAYWFLIGGGTYLERFLMMLVPFSIFAMLSLIKKVSKTQARIVMALFVLIQSGIISIDPRFDYSREKYDRWVNLGNYLSKNHQGKVIAADAVGKISYYSGLHTIDMLGLNDPYIAKINPEYFSPGHNKFDPDYIIARTPDLISAWIANCTERDCNWLNLSYGLTEEKYLQNGYILDYLVFTGNAISGDWIRDVSQYDRQAKLDLIDQGYTYAVLRRAVEN